MFLQDSGGSWGPMNLFYLLPSLFPALPASPVTGPTGAVGTTGPGKQGPTATVFVLLSFL